MRRWPTLLVLSGIAVACTRTPPLARMLDAGRCDAVIAAFGADSAAQANPVAMRIAARAHIDPTCAAWTPDSALALLLRASALGAPPSAEDRRLEAVVRAYVNEREQRVAQVERLQRILTLREAELVAVLSERDALHDMRAILEEERARLLNRVARLDVTIAELQEQVTMLRAELDGLKRIDLRPGRP